MRRARDIFFANHFKDPEKASHNAPVVTMRSIIALQAPSIPGGSKPWVRARRASLALLPQRPRHNERRTGAKLFLAKEDVLNRQQGA
jgi:hypothetical protein